MRATLDRIASRDPGLHATCHNADIQVPALLQPLRRLPGARARAAEHVDGLLGVKPCGLGLKCGERYKPRFSQVLSIVFGALAHIDHLAHVALGEAGAQGINGCVLDGLLHHSSFS
jgi:hypothetical protein